MRRALIIIAVSATAAFGASSASAQQKLVWNHNIFGPQRAVTAGVEAIRDFYLKESNGSFEIKMAYGSALGPERQVPEAIKAGGYESGMFCAGYYPNKFPLLSVLELPFLAPVSLADNAKVNEAVLTHPLIVKEMAERWNLKYFGPTFLPTYEFMGNRRVASVADMKGVRVRIGGLNAKALQRFGAVSTMVTAPEAYTALERGTIDMFGLPYSYTFGAYKLHEVSKYVTEGMAMSGLACFQGVSITAWNKVPDNLKAKLDQAKHLSVQALLAAYKKADEHWIPIFKQKLEVVPFPAAERAKLEAGANDIWEAWVKDQEAAGRPGREILNFVKAEVAKVKK